MHFIRQLADPDTYMTSDLIPKQAEQEMERILQGMLQFDVDKRFSANDTLEHIKDRQLISIWWISIH